MFKMPSDNMADLSKMARRIEELYPPSTMQAVKRIMQDASAVKQADVIGIANQTELLRQARLIGTAMRPLSDVLEQVRKQFPPKSTLQTLGKIMQDASAKKQAGISGMANQTELLRQSKLIEMAMRPLSVVFNQTREQFPSDPESVLKTVAEALRGFDSQGFASAMSAQMKPDIARILSKYTKPPFAPSNTSTLDAISESIEERAARIKMPFADADKAESILLESWEESLGKKNAQRLDEQKLLEVGCFLDDALRNFESFPVPPAEPQMPFPSSEDETQLLSFIGTKILPVTIVTTGILLSVPEDLVNVLENLHFASAYLAVLLDDIGIHPIMTRGTTLYTVGKLLSIVFKTIRKI